MANIHGLVLSNWFGGHKTIAMEDELERSTTVYINLVFISIDVLNVYLQIYITIIHSARDEGNLTFMTRFKRKLILPTFKKNLNSVQNITIHV